MPITKLPIAAAPPIKCLRLTFSRIACTSSFLRGDFDGSADALIRAASADVARHCIVDVLIARFRLLREQIGGLHDLSALAVAALRNDQVLPRRLHLTSDRRAADAFDGDDRF